MYQEGKESRSGHSEFEPPWSQLTEATRKQLNLHIWSLGTKSVGLISKDRVTAAVGENELSLRVQRRERGSRALS